MKVNVHQFIRHQVMQSVLSTRELARTSLDPSVGLRPPSLASLAQGENQGHIGIELQKFASTQPYEKLESYASLKRKNKIKSKIMRTLGTLFIVSLILNLLLWAYTVHLNDSILWHQYLEHQDNER